MEVPTELLLALVAVAALGWLVAWGLMASARTARTRVAELTRERQSQAVRYGNLSEQFAPWMAGWPFEPSNFRFIGKPIDGVQFEEDAVYFVEIKSASSKLSTSQQAIRRAVVEGRVGWIGFNVAEGKPVEVVEPWKRVFGERRR